MRPSEKALLMWLVTDTIQSLDDYTWSSRAERRAKLKELVQAWMDEEKANPPA